METDCETPNESDLLKRPGSLFRRSYQICGAVFARVYDGLNLTQTQFGVLFCLHFQGPADQTAVARELGLDKATLGLVIGGLSRRGLITRTRRKDDRRRIELRITRAGTVLFKRAEKRSPQFREALMKVLAPEDAATLIWLLSAFVNGHQELARSPLVESKVRRHLALPTR